MNLVDEIDAAHPSRRRRLRAAAVMALGPLAGATIFHEGYRVTISEGPELVADGVIRVSARLTTMGGIDVTPPDYNPHTIVNPPLLVPDLAGPIDRGEVGRYRLDPREALLTVVLRAILASR